MAGELTPKEAEELDRAISESEAYATIARYWHKANGSRITRTSNADKIKALLISKIENENRRRRRVIFTQRVAASILFAIASLSVVYYTTFRSSYELVAQAGVGATCKTTLEDGSVVWLNSESKLFVENHFNRNIRRVKLEGEGYFEVAKNPSKPFVVGLKGGSSVKVLGTKFDISAYGNDRFIKTSVLSGKVAFGTDSRKELLTANQSAILSLADNVLSRNSHEVIPVAPWKEGMLVFSATPLSQIKNILERKFGSKVVISDPELNSVELSGKFTTESLATILELLSLTNHLQVSERQGTYYITRHNS